MFILSSLLAGQGGVRTIRQMTRQVFPQKPARTPGLVPQASQWQLALSLAKSRPSTVACSAAITAATTPGRPWPHQMGFGPGHSMLGEQLGEWRQNRQVGKDTEGYLDLIPVARASSHLEDQAYNS